MGNVIETTNLEATSSVLTNGQDFYAEGLKSTTSYNYYDEIIVNQNLPSFLQKEASTTNSKGQTIKKETKYPDNLPNEYVSLLQNNMLTIPVQTHYYEDGVLINSKKTEFNGTYPSLVKTAKGGDGISNLDPRVHYEQYRNGNPVQVRQVNGTPTVLIWGYDQRYVVAKIENTTYAQIEGLSEFGSAFTISEGLSVLQTNQLRNQLSNALVTTYTYEPLIGVTSITGPDNNTFYYEYDDFHRLKYVKDKDQNLVGKNEYNYRTQN